MAESVAASLNDYGIPSDLMEVSLRPRFADNRLVHPTYLLRDVKQRIRDVRQCPDGLLYLLTDEDDGAVPKIEAAQ